MAYILKIAYKVKRLSQKLFSNFHFNFVQPILLHAYNLVELNNLFETYICSTRVMLNYIYIYNMILIAIYNPSPISH